MDHIAFHAEKCVDCSLCQQVCSLNKLGRIAPSAACIQVHRDWSEYFGEMECRVCDMSHGRVCVEACPVEALTYDAQSDVVRFDADLCTACLACLDACPNVNRDAKTDRIMICDLCDGDPACVKWCPEGALTWEGRL